MERIDEARFVMRWSPASAQPDRFLLTWCDGDNVMSGLHGSRLERAIGVIYRPATERQSHYFAAHKAEQFDAAPFRRDAGGQAARKHG